jgi:hypothetical protein
MIKHQLNEFSAYYLFCRPKKQSIYKIPPVVNFETEIMQSAINFGTKMS